MSEIELWKYPRTPHHPLSETVFSDDKIICSDSLKLMYGKHGIASIKMDGECTSIYPNGYTHARSTNSTKNFPYQAHIKRFASEIGYKIPAGYRLCGENMTVAHKVQYDSELPLFLGFSVWKGTKCLSWQDTKDIFFELGIEPVEVIWEGIITEESVSKLWRNFDRTKSEGVVFRLTDSLEFNAFENSAFKLVRGDFDTDDNLWNPKSPKFNKIKKF